MGSGDRWNNERHLKSFNATPNSRRNEDYYNQYFTCTTTIATMARNRTRNLVHDNEVA